MEPDHLGTQHHAASEVACQQWVNENALRGKAGGKIVKKSKPSGLYVKPVTVHPDKGKPVVQLKHLSKQFQQPIQIENQVKTSVIEPMEVQQSKQKGYGQAWLPRPVGKALDKFNKQMKTKKHQKQAQMVSKNRNRNLPSPQPHSESDNDSQNNLPIKSVNSHNREFSSRLKVSVQNQHYN